MRYLLLILVLSLAACENTGAPDLQSVKDIVYRWEPRQQLCFAMISSTAQSGWRVVSISYVPLSKEACR